MNDQDQFYEVLDSDGVVVRRAAAIITTNEFGHTYLSYEQLWDLPLGEYTIQPGAVKVTVTPDMKPLG